MAHVHHMEIQSDGGRTTIQQATEILNTPAVWTFFDGLVASVTAGGAGIANSHQLESATYLLAHAVLRSGKRVVII